MIKKDIVNVGICFILVSVWYNFLMDEKFCIFFYNYNIIELVMVNVDYSLKILISGD